MTRVWWCRTCREKRSEPVQCAPLRCYCNHPECPAYHSYVNLRETA